MLRTDGGYGVPGMPGNGGAVAGVFPMSQEEFRDRVERQMDEKRLKELSAPGGPLENGFIDYIRRTGYYPPVRGASAAPALQGSSNLPGAVGNMGGVQNAQFFGGPQLAQMPAGFQGKYVS